MGWSGMVENMDCLRGAGTENHAPYLRCWSPGHSLCAFNRVALGAAAAHLAIPSHHPARPVHGRNAQGELHGGTAGGAHAHDGRARRR